MTEQYSVKQVQPKHSNPSNPFKNVGKIFSYIILIGLTLTFLLPFLFMVSTALKPTSQLYSMPMRWLPSPPTLDNLVKGWTAVNFTRYTLNTLIIAVTGTLGTVITTSLIAYGFARFQCKLNNLLFVVVLTTMMLPSQLITIPSYVMYSKIGWLDTYIPLILPSWLGLNAFNIFMLRQFIRGIPQELDQAAMLDGCNSLQTFYKILLPAIKPALTSVGIMALIGSWNDFLGPLLYLSTSSKFTIAIGLQFFNSSHGDTKMNQLMAIALVTAMPLIILFFCAQRYFVQGITVSGLKG